MEAAQALGGVGRSASVAYTRNSDQAAFEKIFSAHYGRVLGIVARLAGEGVTAEELANEVFWKLYNQLASAPAWSNVEGWLYRTATNLGIDAVRASLRRKRYEAAAGEELSGRGRATGPLEEVLRREECRRVRRVLAGMKAAQSELLLLKAGGCSYKEIADAFGVAVGGVGSMLNRAEAEFRKRYLKVTAMKEGV